MNSIVTFLLISLMAVFSSATMSMSGHANMQPKNELQFLVMMTSHHNDAIEMSKLAKTRAQSPEVKKLAAKIDLVQTEEVKKMQTWKNNWYPKSQEADHYMKMDMATLATKKGSEFDKEFLTMMIEHHSQAVEMFRASLPLLKHKESQLFAETGIKDQSLEITQMKDLLK